MERADAYNLYHAKDRFVKQLRRQGFKYEETKGGISSAVYNLGRILDSHPPHLIVPNETGNDKKRIDELSRLRQLAESFKID